MKRKFAPILFLILMLCMIPLAVYAEDSVEESYTTKDSGWVKVDDNTWTYTFDVEDDSLDWEAYESEAPSGYYSIRDKDDPVEVEDNKASITNMGEKYQITLKPNGGKYKGASVNAQEDVVMYSKKNNTLSSPTRAGYNFTGWYVGNVQVFDEVGQAVEGTYWKHSASDAVWIYRGNVTLEAKWEAADFAISYNLDGGEYGASHPSGAKYGTAVTIDAPTRVGYAFCGWVVTGMDDSTHIYGSSATSTTTTNATSLTAEETLGKTYYKNFRESDGEILFTATWEPNIYTISYKGVEKATIESHPSKATVDQSFTVDNPVRPGWTFLGWDIEEMDELGEHYYGDQSTTETSLTEIKDTAFKNLRYESGTVTFTAQWRENIGVITYDANGHGTAPSAVETRYADEVKTPVISTTGYKLVEWNTKADGSGVSYRPDTIFKEANTEPADATLYAIWEEKTWTLTYDYNDDGETSNDYDTLRYSIEYKIKSETPTRDGYTFKEWNTGRKGGGTGYQPGQVFKAANTEIAEDETLYAIWEEETATLTYDANGHGTAPDAVTLTYNKSYTIEPGPSAIGWVFTGWNTKADGSGTMYQGGDVFKNAKVSPVETTLYAIWVKETHTMTVSGNGGTPDSTTYTLVVNDTQNTTISLPSKDGLTCSGLYTRKVGGVRVYDDNGKITNDGTYFKEGVFIYHENFTLYAQYGDAPVSCIVYDKNCDDEVEDMPAAETKYIGKPITVSSLIPKRDGYEFVCWSTTPEDNDNADSYYVIDGVGSVFPVKNDAAYNNYADGPITLYAIWQATKVQDTHTAKLPITYNFYTADAENKLLDTEIVYSYKNFFRQDKEVKVRRTIFVDSDSEVTPDVVIATPSWHSGDPIPQIADIEGEPTKVTPTKTTEDEPSDTPNITTVTTEEELQNAISSWNYVENGSQNIRLENNIYLKNGITVPADAEVYLDLDNNTISIDNVKVYLYVVRRSTGVAVSTSFKINGANATSTDTGYSEIYICDENGERLTENLVGSDWSANTNIADLYPKFRLEVDGALSNLITVSRTSTAHSTTASTQASGTSSVSLKSTPTKISSTYVTLKVSKAFVDESSESGYKLASTAYTKSCSFTYGTPRTYKYTYSNPYKYTLNDDGTYIPAYYTATVSVTYNGARSIKVTTTNSYAKSSHIKTTYTYRYCDYTTYTYRADTTTALMGDYDKTVTEVTDSATMPTTVNLSEVLENDEYSMSLSLQKDGDSIDISEYDSLYVCDSEGNHITPNLVEYVSDGVVSWEDEEAVIHSLGNTFKIEVNGHLSEAIHLYHSGATKTTVTETTEFDSSGNLEYTLERRPIKGTGIGFGYTTTTGEDMVNELATAGSIKTGTYTYGLYASSYSYDGDKTITAKVTGQKPKSMSFKYTYYEDGEWWTGTDEEEDSTDIEFGDWTSREFLIEAKGISNTAFRVRGNLDLTNGTVSAVNRCVSLQGMGVFTASDSVTLNGASYAVYFENGAGSVMAFLNGTTVDTSVLCGTENEHSKLTLDDYAKVSSGALYSDFTTKNSKGLAFTTGYTIANPKNYVDKVASTILDSDIEGYNYKIENNSELESCVIDFEPNDDGIGTVNGNGDYPSGGEVTLEAVPENYATFEGWYDADGNLLSKNATWTFTCTGDLNGTAVFNTIKHTLTVLAQDDAMGTVSGGGEYAERQMVTITATPNKGYTFAGWLKDESEEYFETTPTMRVAVEADVTYTAVFRPVGYILKVDVPSYLDADELLTVTVNGEALPEDGQVEFSNNTQVNIYATVGDAEGYSVKGFYDNEAKEYVAEGRSYEFKITDDTEVEVVLDVDDTVAKEIIDDFVERQNERIDSELTTYTDGYYDEDGEYHEGFIEKAQPVGSVYISTDSSLGKGEDYDNEESESYQVDEGLETIESIFGGKWERIENTFLYADGDEDIGETGGRWKYKFSLAMNVDSNSIAFALENRNNYQEQSLQTVLKLKFGEGGSLPTNTVVVTEAAQGTRETEIVPPYQSVFMFKRVE